MNNQNLKFDIGEYIMLNGVGIILGVACSLVGIAGGYLLLSTVFAGIQLISKHRMFDQNMEKKLDT